MNFDIWHQVPLVPQLTGMSCWAAAAAMLVGWRECIHTRPDEIAHGSGFWEAYRDGLDPDSIGTLSKTWRLHPVNHFDISVANLRHVLANNGPLWVGEASPGLHSIVITGIYGDGSEENSFVRINDPWPIGGGERYSKSVKEFKRDFTAATQAVGQHTQILHAGGRNARLFGSKSFAHAAAAAPPSFDQFKLSDNKRPTNLHYGSPGEVKYSSSLHEAIDNQNRSTCLQTLNTSSFIVEAGECLYRKYCKFSPQHAAVQPQLFRWPSVSAPESVLDLIIINLDSPPPVCENKLRKFLSHKTDCLMRNLSFPTFVVTTFKTDIATFKSDCAAPESQNSWPRDDNHELRAVIFDSLNWLQQNLIGATNRHCLYIRNVRELSVTSNLSQPPNKRLRLRDIAI